MKYATGIITSVYEDDLKAVVGGSGFRYRPIEIKGLRYRVKANPGKRPKRKPGESPLDPPRE